MLGVPESIGLKHCGSGGVDFVERERLTNCGGDTHAQHVDRLFEAQQDQWPIRRASERLDYLLTVAGVKFLLELRDLVDDSLEAKCVGGGERIEAPEGCEDVHKSPDERDRRAETRSVLPRRVRAERKPPQA